MSETRPFIAYVEETVQHKCALDVDLEVVADWWNELGSEVLPWQIKAEHVLLWLKRRGELSSLLSGSLDSAGLGNFSLYRVEEVD